MPIEVVQSIEASVAEVIVSCSAVAEARKWKVISDRTTDGGLTFKTPANLWAFLGQHLDVSIQQQGKYVLMTVWVQSVSPIQIDLTREGARLARQFTRDVLDKIQHRDSQF